MGKVAAYFELQALEALADIHIDRRIKEAKAQSKVKSRRSLLRTAFCPYKHKYELVDWAFSYFKEISNFKGIPKSKYQKMSRKQLYAIWFKVQRDNQQRTT